MAPITRSAAAAGLLSGTAASAGPPNQPPSFFPLLSLPRDVLALVIAMVGKNKAPWRLACAQLRDMVDSAITALGCRRMVGQRGLVFTSQLIMRLPRLTRVYMSGCRDIGDLSPLAACIALHTLNCSRTAVINLAPLASCTSLHTLDCYGTAVSSLEPLSACASLYTLDCCGTAVSSLAPLAACTSLRNLYCNRTGISSLEGLANHTSLHTLSCYSTAVSSLAPLASCTSLHTLYCYGTAVNSLAPLASCTSLMMLVCNSSLSTDFDFMKNAKIDTNDDFDLYVIHFH